MARKARSSSTGGPSKKKPKRIRRKCSAPNCTNRVVQGGVCVTHGAKRKLCGHPGCTKAVKLAGFCSTHGPARRKCDHAGCTRVAVQGGKCLSHGARRRVCDYPLTVDGNEKCAKNAIMGGMCKKHFDRVQEAEGMLSMCCVPVNTFSSGGGMGAAGSVGGASCGSEGGSLDSAPSWGSASAVTATTTVASAYPTTVASSYLPTQGRYQPPAKVPKVAVAPSITGSRSRCKKPKPTHQRGLSIFEEMQTVDAIIGNVGSSEGSQPPPPPQQQVASYSQPPAAPPQVVSSSMSAKTPTAQVSFADGTKKSTAAPVAEGEPPCTGDASCTCNACRSPTLAIFEQMIQASQKLESGEVDTNRYPALSPPKLSPRKTATNGRGRLYADCEMETTTPKNVSFLPEEPTSSGSVVRKVSSNNIVGEGQAVVVANNAGVGGGEAVKSAVNYPPYHHQQQPQPDQARQDYPPHGQEGPASHALAAIAKDEEVSRTVSHDVDDGTRYHYSSSYHPHHQHHQRGPPPPGPHSGLGYHQGHHYPKSHVHKSRPPPPPGPGHPQQARYQGPSPPPPYHGHPSQHRGPPQPHYGHHQRGPTPPNYPGGYPQPPSHQAGGMVMTGGAYHQDFRPPQTPALYEGAHNASNGSTPMAVVSSHSTHHSDQHLLPKRRDGIEHLFIPKEV